MITKAIVVYADAPDQEWRVAWLPGGIAVHPPTVGTTLAEVKQLLADLAEEHPKPPLHNEGLAK